MFSRWETWRWFKGNIIVIMMLMMMIFITMSYWLHKVLQLYLDIRHSCTLLLRGPLNFIQCLQRDAGHKSLLVSQQDKPTNQTTNQPATALNNSYFIFCRDHIFIWSLNSQWRSLTFSMRMPSSVSVDKILLPRCMNWSTDIRGVTFNGERAPTWLKDMNSDLSGFTYRVNTNC